MRRYKEDDGWMDRKNNPQITQIARIKLNAGQCVKKYNLREPLQYADCFEPASSACRITADAKAA